MAEEDLIFGKNRHLFGGIEPSNMILSRYVKKFSPDSTSGSPNKDAELDLVLPNDTVIDGQTLCTVAGAIVRKKTGSYPVDEFDGELVRDIKAEDGSSHTIWLGTADDTLYYAAFPYTTQGVYNRSTANRCSRYPYKKYLFGFDLNLTNDNPNTRVSYPSDVDNYKYTSARIVWNTGTGTFQSGSWVLTGGTNFMPIPCVLGPSGTVLQYLNETDYTKTINGKAPLIHLTDSGVNVMMRWPKIYTHREIDGNYYKFRCSDTKLGDDWECWCNYDANGNEIDYFYTGVYLGKKDSDGKLRSVSGQTPDYFTSVEDMQTAVWKNGSEWSTDVLVDRLLIQDLLIMIMKTTDIKSRFGSGETSSTDTTGRLDTKGLFASLSLSNVCKVFGMEDFWSNHYRYLSGLTYGKGLMEIKTNVKKGNVDDNIAVTFDQTGGGYIKSSIVRSYGRLPGSDLGGSSSTYDCDPLIYDSSNVRPAYGGYAPLSTETTAGLKQGPFAMSFVNASKIYASLSCKPLAKKGGNE